MKHHLNYIGQLVAALSFVIGTCLLAFYLYFGNNFIPLGLALLVVIVTVIVNSILFIVILLSALFKKTNKIEALKTCGVMLLNIPIAILYFYMVITFPNQHLIL